MAFDDNTCVHSVLDCNTFLLRAPLRFLSPPMLASAARTCMLAALTIVEQTLHMCRERRAPATAHTLTA